MPRPPILSTLDWKSLFTQGQEYKAWITAGENENNREQMDRDRRTFPLEPHEEAALRALSRLIHVAAIAEDWCGDVVRHVPVLQRMADCSPNLMVQYFTREQSPEMFVRFLTNGGEAIPKFIFLSDAFVECGNWGPMPAGCREVIARGKACGDGDAARERVSALYRADPDRRQVVQELLQLVDIASSTRP